MRLKLSLKGRMKEATQKRDVSGRILLKWGCLLWDNEPESESIHSSLCNDEVENAWSFTSVPQSY
jgi:hypothetical protein